MKNRIITVSREFGSGGRTIGKQVAKELGIPCYDNELIQKIASESGFDEHYVKDAGEYDSGGFLSIFSSRAFGDTNADLIWKAQCKIILQLAEKEPCVIVGRCADYILRDKADCLRVLFMRIRIFVLTGLSKSTAKPISLPNNALKKSKKPRAAYHRFYTNMKWGQSKNYDITLNSGTLGIDKCVEIIKNLY